MSQFRFAQLSWLHAIWFVLGLAFLLIVLELRGRSILDQMVSRLMQVRLVRQSSLARRIGAILLMALSLAALVVAMMRPQWGVTVQRLARINSQIMVCLDVSKSMLAEDVAPNRLDRAKAELESLLALMEEGQQVGLIAFAGKAAVLCPMTTDFGFLRLVLTDARPSTVGLGGTNIGEALRKAVEGFGAAGDVNRLILLITDGEDHDSFPLDAAKAAKERGIRIISIGFGDEAGSKIEITDPRTGVRSFVKNTSGQDVVSRLDGTTLREIALETDGAYVPAGTGVLDLESIYQTHIASMLRGTTTDQEQILRNEAYQWCVVASLVFLILGLLTASPWSLGSRDLASGQRVTVGDFTRAAVGAGILCLLAGADLVAQIPPQTDEGTATDIRAGGPSAKETEQSPRRDDISTQEEIPPREAYNNALAFVRSDPDRAQRLLNQARREAGVDGEVRFRALYNLGWVEVNRADAVLQEQPQVALEHLEQSAHRFREAIRVRPDNLDARHNLEVVSRRILELADALAKQDPRNLDSRLDELIQTQRAAQSELATLVQRAAADDAGPDQHRLAFRRAGISQRQIISDMQKFASDARRELDLLEQKTDEERSAEEQLRSVQLKNMLLFVESSLQRMQKARGLTRRMQGSRGFARWSSALTAAKRARDQLRNPVEILGVITDDALRLAELTRTMSLTRSTLIDDDGAVTAPAWLTKEYLQDTQGSTTERTVELAAMLAAVTTESNAGGDSAPATKAAEDPRAKQLMENIKLALPLLQQASQAFREAGSELEADRFESGYEQQQSAIASLRAASELFFDVRRLIELIYGQQQLMRAAMQSTRERPVLADSLVAAISEALSKNQQRCQRLDSMFDAELARIADSAAQAAQGPPPPDAEPNPEIQRYRQAKQILQGAVEDMEQLGTILEPMETRQQGPPPTARDSDDVSVKEASAIPGDAGDNELEEPSTPDDAGPVADDPADAQETSDPMVSDALIAFDASLEKIEQLRRLFFSLVEHLRDTAQRQGDLSDSTSEVAGKSESQTPEEIGPLANRQQQLQAISAQLSQALHQQAQQAEQATNQAASPTTPPSGEPDPAATTKSLQQAGDLVGEATSAMEQATGGLTDASAGKEGIDMDFDRIGQHQRTALEKLFEALALLDDPPDQNENQGNQQQKQPQQDQEDEQQQQQQQQQQQNLNANQLLQLIRDREAQRRQDRQRAAESATGTVEKDW